MINHKILLGIAITCLSLILWNCVDVPTSGQLPSDELNFHSLFRLVHVANDASTGASSITMDGAAVGSLSFGEAGNYMDALSGGRNLSFQGVTQKVNLTSARQHTVLIVAQSGGTRFVNLDESYTDADNSNPDVALVHFVHVARTSAPTIAFYDSLPSGLNYISPAYLSSPGYVEVANGLHDIVVVSSGGYEADLNGTPNGVTTNSNGKAEVSLSLEDGFDYTVTVNSENTGGWANAFYTSAHFHHAPAGSVGPVALPIDVTGQKITFNPDTLARLDTGTIASGNVSFALTANGARTDFSLSYSVFVKTDTVDTEATAIHFHRGGPGQTGPVVKTITSTSFTGERTFSGVWSTSDGEPLTPDLVDSLLAGRIYVNVHSGLHPIGTLRAQVVPTSLSKNTYTGSWNDAALTDSVKREIVLGNFYVNFHNTTYPNGQIRGQLEVDSAKGHYGVTTATGWLFEAGRKYTVVAIGAGTTLQLMKFSERQFGLTKNSSHVGYEIEK